MRITEIGLILGLLLALGPLPEAAAHGGNYRGPAGAVPPNLREPSDAAPPAPPLPGARAGPPIPPPRPSGSPSRQARPAPPMDFSAWVFWYHHQRERYEPRPAAALAFAREGEPLARHVLPALVRATSRKAHRSHGLAEGALIALGRAARGTQHVDVLVAALESEEPATYREAAAVAVGLLRRTDPALQFPASQLDAVRDRLYRVAKNDALPGRLRALATISLGLLGDQPTASRALAKATLARLFKLLAIRHRYMDLTAALLHAASFQPEAAWTEEQRALLTTVLRTGGLPGGGRTFALDAQAAIALGRIAGPGDLALFAEMIGPKHVRRRNVRRSTVIALGTLAERHDGATRTAVAALLSAALPLERDPTTRKLLTIALGRTAAAAIRATRTFDETAQGLAGLLHATLRPGDDAAAPLPRNASYAMLGLALIGRALADVSAPAGPAWRQTTGTVLRRAAEDAGQSERHRAGAAMALGLLGRSADRDVLLALLSDTERTPLLRGAAARALGLVGPADAATLSLLHALFEESPRWPVRVHAAGALAALGDHTATEFLVTQLQARHASDQGAAAQALGNLGSAALVERLLAILQDGNQPMRARMAACAALGCMGDPEPRPSLARVVNDMNWRAGGGLFHWLADLL